MAVLILVVLVFAGLVWLGRRGPAVLRGWRAGSGVLALAVMVAAAAAGVRGAWPMTVAFAVLAAWLALSARRRSPRPAEPQPRMGEAEARALLGVGPEAGPAEIQAAWLRLMRTVHPDRGGTAGLAAQLNAARDRLLRR